MSLLTETIETSTTNFNELCSAVESQETPSSPPLLEFNSIADIFRCEPKYYGGQTLQTERSIPEEQTRDGKVTSYRIYEAQIPDLKQTCKCCNEQGHLSTPEEFNTLLAWARERSLEGRGFLAPGQERSLHPDINGRDLEIDQQIREHYLKRCDSGFSDGEDGFDPELEFMDNPYVDVHLAERYREVLKATFVVPVENDPFDTELEDAWKEYCDLLASRAASNTGAFVSANAFVVSYPQEPKRQELFVEWESKEDCDYFHASKGNLALLARLEHYLEDGKIMRSPGFPFHPDAYLHSTSAEVLEFQIKEPVTVEKQLQLEFLLRHFSHTLRGKIKTPAGDIPAVTPYFEGFLDPATNLCSWLSTLPAGADTVRAVFYWGTGKEGDLDPEVVQRSWVANFMRCSYREKGHRAHLVGRLIGVRSWGVRVGRLGGKGADEEEEKEEDGGVTGVGEDAVSGGLMMPMTPCGEPRGSTGSGQSGQSGVSGQSGGSGQSEVSETPGSSGQSGSSGRSGYSGHSIVRSFSAATDGSYSARSPRSTTPTPTPTSSRSASDSFGTMFLFG